MTTEINPLLEWPKSLAALIILGLRNLSGKSPDEIKQVKQGDSFWFIDGKVYDLNPLATSHPGGSWVINESRGFDVTYMLQTNHGWGKEHAMKRLAKYQVVNIGLEGRPLISWDARL